MILTTPAIAPFTKAFVGDVSPRYLHLFIIKATTALDCAANRLLNIACPLVRLVIGWILFFAIRPTSANKPPMTIN